MANFASPDAGEFGVLPIFESSGFFSRLTNSGLLPMIATTYVLMDLSILSVVIAMSCNGASVA